MHPFSLQYRQWRKQEKIPFLRFPAGGRRLVLASLSPYALGMSNLGYHTVYRLVNTTDDLACERTFLPPPQETEVLKRCRRRLTTLETETPVGDFPLVALSISFEADYLSLPRFLEASGIPLWASQRADSDPVILAGGAAVFLNPEPIADFVDVFALGEGEELIPKLEYCLKRASSRRELIEGLAWHPGFYLPRNWIPEYGVDGTLAGYQRQQDQPLPPLTSDLKVRRVRVFKPFAEVEPPHSVILTPQTEMGDKLLVEISRGCRCGCRFCWAGYNYLPVRTFPSEVILTLAQRYRCHTEKIGLVSAAVGDHPELETLLQGLKKLEYRVSYSSLRLDNLTLSTVDSLLQGGEKTLTIAPEAGTDRLRRVLNKGLSNQQIMESCDRLFKQGVLNLKCYFMYGLPTETGEDLDGIVQLVQQIRNRMLERRRTRKSIGKISVDLHPFVPKPNTPFQWCAMEAERDLKRKMQFLQQRLRPLDNVMVRAESPRLACLQALLSRGDRRLGAWIAALDGRITEWRQVAKEIGLDLNFHLGREKTREEVFPWHVFAGGLNEDYLWSEHGRAGEGRLSAPCPETPSCRRCGACDRSG